MFLIPPCFAFVLAIAWIGAESTAAEITDTGYHARLNIIQQRPPSIPRAAGSGVEQLAKRVGVPTGTVARTQCWRNLLGQRGASMVPDRHSTA